MLIKLLNMNEDICQKTLEPINKGMCRKCKCCADFSLEIEYVLCFYRPEAENKRLAPQSV